MTLDVKDFETESKTVATITFEAIDLDEITDENQIII